MNEFLESEGLKEMFERHGFPVKINIPIGYSIQANVVFNSYRDIEATENCEELFRVPAEFTKVPRREGMKTLKNKRKRMVFANLNIN